MFNITYEISEIFHGLGEWVYLLNQMGFLVSKKIRDETAIIVLLLVNKNGNSFQTISITLAE